MEEILEINIHGGMNYIKQNRFRLESWFIHTIEGRIEFFHFDSLTYEISCRRKDTTFNGRIIY